MSSTGFLVLGLLCTFGAVLLLGLAVDFSLTERRRALRLLQTQLGVTAPGEIPNLREQELSRGFAQRAILPLVEAAGRAARRFTPIGARERYSRKLVLAGSPAGWDAERVAAFKVIGGIVGLVVGIFVTSAVGMPRLPQIGIVILLTAVGFFGPDAVLDRKVQDRQREILRALPDTLDLLTISVEAGLSLNAAIGQVVKTVPGTLSRELARMLQEIQLGVSRADAFKNLAARTDVEELNGFVLAMVQADVFGVPISQVLRAQSKDLRIRRRQKAQKQAQQMPVKIVFPLILCILPALFIVVAGPGVIRIMNALLGPGGVLK